jgi:hypothetical protein
VTCNNRFSGGYRHASLLPLPSSSHFPELVWLSCLVHPALSLLNACLMTKLRAYAAHTVSCARERASTRFPKVLHLSLLPTVLNSETTSLGVRITRTTLDNYDVGPGAALRLFGRTRLAWSWKQHPCCIACPASGQHQHYDRRRESRRFRVRTMQSNDGVRIHHVRIPSQRAHGVVSDISPCVARRRTTSTQAMG